jgi:hypothetical protein
MLRDATEAPELITAKELAHEWRQHVATIYRRIEWGEIPAIHLGTGTSALRVPRAELEARLHRDIGPGLPGRPRYPR